MMRSEIELDMELVLCKYIRNLSVVDELFQGFVPVQLPFQADLPVSGVQQTIPGPERRIEYARLYIQQFLCRIGNSEYTDK